MNNEQVEISINSKQQEAKTVLEKMEGIKNIRKKARVGTRLTEGREMAFKKGKIVYFWRLRGRLKRGSFQC